MKKYILSTALSTLIAFNVCAQDADLVSDFMDEAVTVNTNNSKKTDEKITEEKDTFSFLNFSFIKNPFSFFSSNEKKNESEAGDASQQTEKSGDTPQKQETPLEKNIRLAENGDTESALALGYMYLYGQNGVETDYNKAFHFYALAAEQNNVIALNNLGSLYFNGIGTEKDYKKAALLFKKAAELGSDDAAVNLAFIYLSSDDDALLEPAIALFKQAAQADNNTAKFMLGYAYYKGVGVEQNFYEAVNLIKEAVRADFDEAEYIFAKIYVNGEGITQNYGNAVKYYRMAIAQGHVEAMMDLAQILTEGRLFPQNLIQAHILYNIASVYGVSQAAQKRDSLEEYLKLEELLEAQNSAEKYHETPSEFTQYIRQTFGPNVRRYIDSHLPKKGKTK